MKILIAVDDDSESRDAILFASRILPDEAQVIVVNVTQYAVTPFGTLGSTTLGVDGQLMVAPEVHEELARQAREQAERTVHSASELLPGAEERVVTGDAGPRICELAEEEGADLVVLGTHDRSGWSRLWFGSVSDHVVHHAPCPVLVVRS